MTALVTKRVLPSLFAGIVLGVLIVNGFDPLASAVACFDLFVRLLSEAWILKTLAFAVLVGSVMALISASGGIEGFVNYVTQRRSLVTSQRSALLLTYVIGIVIFIESSITSLIAGTVGRPLTDAYGVSRAKLAYVCDSTSAPVCSLILLNGWGALLLGLITAQISAGMIAGESVGWLLQAVPYNFYAWSALAVTLAVVWYGVDIGPMKDAEVFRESETSGTEKGRIGYMIWPIVLMIASVFAVLLATGDGNILHGSGSTALFYTTIITVLFCVVYYGLSGGMRVRESVKHTLIGARSMVGIAAILLFAFAISDVTKSLETGLYIASFTEGVLSPGWLAGIIFLLAAVMAFATGTSWGTFSIMIPIAVPLAVALDADVALCM
ncbi:MAG: Na+/H+ antiporter NhaC family protein, partial [Sulfurimonadaceae bacterium]|nr:Na+/H+ antiporter NhaC family protein [Sulfurimonadaceae bacterium]